jgi:hypothetical protein
MTNPASVELRTLNLHDVVKMTEYNAEYRKLSSSFNKIAEFVPAQVSDVTILEDYR